MAYERVGATRGQPLIDIKYLCVLEEGENSQKSHRRSG